MMENFDHLLSPYSVEQFFAKNWQEKGVYIRGNTTQKFQNLFSWKSLNYLLNFHSKSYPLFRLAQNKKVLGEEDNQKFLQKCQEGATLIIDQVDKRLPEITQLANAIRHDLGLGHRTQVNAYCSWPGKQGFDCHYDTHEVFILQTEGCKEWFVFTDTIKAPLPNQTPGETSPPDTPPYIQTTLHPGDLLYIPRGHWHYAIAKDQPSVHLTLGVHCRKGIDLLDWLKVELKEQQHWRVNLPPGINQLHSETLEKHLENLTQDLISYLQKPDLSRKYADYLASLEISHSGYDFPYQVGFGLDAITLETRFFRLPYQRILIESFPDKKQYRIRAGNKEVKLAGVPGQFLDNLFSQQEFSGNEIQQWLDGFDWEIEISPLLSRLVKERIIFIKHDIPCSKPDLTYQELIK